MDWQGYFTSFIFPRRCAACGALLTGGAVCEACFEGIALARFAARALAPQFYWRARFPYIMGAASSYHGAPAVAALIQALKFRGIRAASEPIADLMASYAMPLRRRLDGYTVVPVPLSRKRLRERGFNQSELIASSFAKRLSLASSSVILARTRHGPPQTAARGAAERIANVRGAFAIPAASAAAVRGGRFILIDDVTTTGATLLEAARALVNAGAAHVAGMAAAKA